MSFKKKHNLRVIWEKALKDDTIIIIGISILV